MTFKMKKVTQAVVCAAGLIGMSGAAHAVNWLQVQGTEPSYSVARAKVWGFIQPEYQYTKNTPLKGGPFAGQPAVFERDGRTIEVDARPSDALALAPLTRRIGRLRSTSTRRSSWKLPSELA